jgi:uncharacterized protein (TIGR03546 family)
MDKTLFIMLIGKFVRLAAAINANSRPGEIAAGIAFGMLLALIPSGNLLWIVLFAATFFLPAELVFLALFKLIAPLLDGWLHSAGYAVLTLPFLNSTFTSLYNIPIVPFTRFNNTLVMGGFLTGLALWLPLFFIARWLVTLYRLKIRDRIAESRVVKALKKLPWVSRLARAVQRAGTLGRSR